MRVFERKQEIKGTLHIRREPQNEVPAVLVPAEKRSPDGFITVSVVLPNGNIELKFRKRHVFSNAHVSQLTKGNFERAVVNALEPLLGRVETL